MNYYTSDASQLVSLCALGHGKCDANLLTFVSVSKVHYCLTRKRKPQHMGRTVQSTRSILTNNWDCWSSHVVNIIQWHWSTPKISLLFWCSLISVIWISTRQSKLKYWLLSAYQKQKNEIWRKLHLLGIVGKMCPPTRVIYFIISISLIFHFFLPIARVLRATCCPQALDWEALALKHLFSECVSQSTTIWSDLRNRTLPASTDFSRDWECIFLKVFSI